MITMNVEYKENILSATAGVLSGLPESRVYPFNTLYLNEK